LQVLRLRAAQAVPGAAALVTTSGAPLTIASKLDDALLRKEVPGEWRARRRRHSKHAWGHAPTLPSSPAHAARAAGAGLIRIPLADGIRETAELYRALHAAGKLTV
jgi:hypothetical protein